jgi:hypothetical protein
MRQGKQTTGKNKKSGKNRKKVLTRFWHFSYKRRFTLQTPSTS